MTADQELIIVKKKKFGGRKKGTPNKPKNSLTPAQQKHSDLLDSIKAGLRAAGLPANYNPLVAMAVYAESDIGKQNPTLAMACHKEVAQYLYPKKRSVDVKVDTTEGVVFIIEGKD